MTEENEGTLDAHQAPESNQESIQESVQAESNQDDPVANDESPMDDLFLSPEDSQAEIVGAAEAAPSNDPPAVDAAAHNLLGARVAELEAKLGAAESERDDFKNRLMRTAADLENFRKRAARERDDMRKYGIDKVVLDLLPVIDNLDRALEHAEKSEQASSIIDGVRMVYRQFLSALEKHGVTSFDARGEHFDPTRHEAIQQVESSEHETGTVLEQYQRGYFLHDRLIRPAMVAVAKRTHTPEDTELAVIDDAQEDIGIESSEESAE